MKMMLTRALAVFLIAAPAFAYPKPLTHDQLKTADAKSDTLFIDCTDAYLDRLARFKNLRDLTLTGPYSSYW